MRILLDFHHHALAESLLRLFEDRWGALCYFPAGMDWYDAGIWQFERRWHGDAVARQYLEGIWAGAETLDDGVIRRADPRHPGRYHHGIERADAALLRWDLVISSLPDNDEGYAAFAADTGARFGVQLGNNHQASRLDLASFILSSSTLPGRERETADPASWGRVVDFAGVPCVIYHQEFSREIFRPGTVAEAVPRTVASFVNCFPETPVYPAFRALTQEWAGEATWRVYGAYGKAAIDELAAGDVSSVPAVADAMRATRIGWHEKYWGDGFGHTAHNWAAVGRPVLVSRRYYVDKLAGPLFVPGETAWDIDSLARDELLAVLRRLRDDDDWYAERCAAMAARFSEIVDFDREAAAIAEMLGIGRAGAAVAP